MERVHDVEDGAEGYECPDCGFINSPRRKTTYSNRRHPFMVTRKSNVMPVAICECGYRDDMYQKTREERSALYGQI
jgi:hypothetical protein